WAYGRGPCRACGRCNGADGRRRVGPDGKGPEGRRRSPPHRPELVRCRGQPTRRRVTRARVLRPSPTWGVRRQLPRRAELGRLKPRRKDLRDRALLLFGFAGGLAPRLSSTAVICNKGVSYRIGLTQD